MYAYIKGTILLKESTSLIVMAGDIGYRIFMTEETMRSVEEGDHVSLFLFHYIRENAMELYGFDSQENYNLFSSLLSVSGVGPKTALSVLRLASAQDIRRAISQGNAALLKSVSGIGSKTAERIVVELKNIFHEDVESDSLDGQTQELIDALMNLGYSRVHARDALRGIPSDCRTIEEKLTFALRILGRSS